MILKDPCDSFQQNVAENSFVEGEAQFSIQFPYLLAMGVSTNRSRATGAHSFHNGATLRGLQRRDPNRERTPLALVTGPASGARSCNGHMCIKD
jgi:hypothetical protein